MDTTKLGGLKVEFIDEFEFMDQVINDYPTLSRFDEYGIGFIIAKITGIGEIENAPCDFQVEQDNPAMLQNLGILLIDGEPPKHVIKAVGEYLLLHANEMDEKIKNTRPQGRPKDAGKKTMDYFKYELVYELQQIQKKEWSEVTDLFNKSIFREGQEPIRKETLRREFGKYRKEHPSAVYVWEKRGTMVDWWEVGLGDKLI